MSRFRLSAGGSRAHEPWFRVGTLDVGTTWLIVFISIAGLLLYAIGGTDLEARLAFTPDTRWIASHPWTLVTWPFAYVNPSFWSVASICHTFARTAVGFGIARFALGLGESGNFPAALKATADWFPVEERALATGIFNSGTSAASLVAPLIIPWAAI